MNQDFYSPPQAEHMVSQGNLAKFSRHIAMTKRWLTFFYAMFIFAMALFGLGFVAVLVAGLFGNPEMIFLSFVYLFGGAVYFYFFFPLMKTRQSAIHFLNTESEMDLDQYLEHTGKMWRMWGMAMVILIGLYFLIFIGAIVIGAGSAMIGA